MLAMNENVSFVPLPRPVSFMNHETLALYFAVVEPRIKTGITLLQCYDIYRALEELADLWHCDLDRHRDDYGELITEMDPGEENYFYTRLTDLKNRFEAFKIDISAFRKRGTDMPHPTELIRRLNLPAENTQLLN